MLNEQDDQPARLKILIVGPGERAGVDIAGMLDDFGCAVLGAVQTLGSIARQYVQEPTDAIVLDLSTKGGVDADTGTLPIVR